MGIKVTEAQVVCCTILKALSCGPAIRLAGRISEALNVE